MDRSLLHFSEEVKQQFMFLEALQFHCVSSSSTLVRYLSADMIINIYHGRKSYEIGLTIESISEQNESYSISEILLLIDVEQGKAYRHFVGWTKENVAKGIQRLADIFSKCINSNVLSDEKFFERLKVQRQSMAKDLALQIRLRQARQKSAMAWARNDFAQVVQLLAPLQAHLKPFELERLEYAKRH